MPTSRLSLFVSTVAVAAGGLAISHPPVVNAAPRAPQPPQSAEILGKVVTLTSLCSADGTLTTGPGNATSARLTLQPGTVSASQKFRIVAAGSNVQVVSMTSGLFLGASPTAQGQPITLTAQPLSWRMRFVGPGQVTFTEASSNLRLDLKGRSTTPGSTFQLWTRNSTCAQRFKLSVGATGVPTTTQPATTQLTTTQPATTKPTTTAPATTAPATTVSLVTTVKPNGAAPGSKWVRMEANLFVDTVPALLDIVKKSKAAGADTILFSDTKVNLWFANPDTSAKWLPLMKEFAAGVRAEGMKLVVQTAPTGYGTPVLFNDPSLTTGYPIVDAPFVVQGDSLVPEQTASVSNGSFETNSANAPADWGFQDAPGSATFIDTAQAKDGKASMRFEGVGKPSGMARIFTETKVVPFQQYTMSFWMKSEGLTAGYLGPVVTSADGERKLSAQNYSFADTNGRNYVSSVRTLTKDWTQIKISFNSLGETSVRFGFGTWDTTAGKLWIDGVKVESTPTLNIIRRDALPLTAKTAAGAPLKEGSDISTVVDPQLGQIEYPGRYDNYHAAPIIKLGTGSVLKNGDRVLLSGYHALITMQGQVSTSWHDPKIFAIMKKIHEQAAASIGADGYLVDMEEVRTGGWEPSDLAFGSSGAALAAHTNRVVSDAAAATGRPIYIWSDMFDPLQNATDDHYHVKGTLSGGWKTLDPKKVTILNWKDRDAPGKTKESVDFFAGLGFKQIVAGYYDRDVQTDYNDWKPALGNPSIIGSMYTSWEQTFDALPAFAALWWR